MARALIREEAYSRLLDASGISLHSSGNSLLMRSNNYSRTIWSGTGVNKTGTSESHDSIHQNIITVFGKASDINAEFTLEYSEDSTLWYRSHKVITCDASGYTSGSYDDIAARYIRAYLASGNSVNVSLVITGK